MLEGVHVSGTSAFSEESPDRFLGYAASALAGLMARCTLLSSDGSTLRPDAVGVRRLSVDPAATIPVGRSPWKTWKDVIVGHLDLLCRLTIPEFKGAPNRLFAFKPKQFGGAPWEVVQQVSAPDKVEFEFSYALPESPIIEDEADYYANLLAVLLDVCNFFQAGKRVEPARFVLHGLEAEIAFQPVARDSQLLDRIQVREKQSRRQPLQGVAATEPRIVALAKHWAAMAGLLDIENRPDGMRLKNLSDWVVQSSGHPSEVYEYLARICNVACKFCYLFGNPQGLAVARGHKVISKDEIDARISYFDPVAKRALFHSQWELNEFLVDPKLASVLSSLRQKSDTPFFFTTNGNPLTPEVIEILDANGPVYLIISVNSLDADLRAEVMGERNRSRTWTALNCFDELLRRKIPFGVSLAAFPDFPIAELTRTIERLDEIGDVAFIRVNLPGFTRDHPYKQDSDLKDYWAEVTGVIQGLRKRVKVPLIVIPSAYEQNLVLGAPLEATVIGTVPNSPAALAGFLPGDVIDHVGTLRIQTRSQALALMSMVKDITTVRIRRGSESLNLVVDPNIAGRYPFVAPLNGKYWFPLGLVLTPSLSGLDAAAVKASVAAVSARRVWIVTSAIMRPAALALLQANLPSCQIEPVIVENNFLGGNIQVLDMATASDISHALAHKLQSQPAPDLVLLPCTGFNKYGRDLAGRHWQDLQREFDFPISLIESTAQFMY